MSLPVGDEAVQSQPLSGLQEGVQPSEGVRLPSSQRCPEEDSGRCLIPSPQVSMQVVPSAEKSKRRSSGQERQ